MLAVAINTGTNLPSVATPNGQAAFLFLLTSALAPLIRLSYGRMVWMALALHHRY
ncbi:sodium/proton antiporter [Klebsiella pneumoniae]|uniref:Sodium/proton antiporter n=1 Tax=Klebsiella pneumoniae TaxID=573 RepID=A0A4P0Y9W6_KLEPN|nr:sodium/proton antiporter [Klebsiella pneumoniae]